MDIKAVLHTWGPVTHSTGVQENDSLMPFLDIGLKKLTVISSSLPLSSISTGMRAPYRHFCLSEVGKCCAHKEMRHIIVECLSVGETTFLLIGFLTFVMVQTTAVY